MNKLILSFAQTTECDVRVRALSDVLHGLIPNEILMLLKSKFDARQATRDSAQSRSFGFKQHASHQLRLASAPPSNFGESSKRNGSICTPNWPAWNYGLFDEVPGAAYCRVGRGKKKQLARNHRHPPRPKLVCSLFILHVPSCLAPKLPERGRSFSRPVFSYPFGLLSSLSLSLALSLNLLTPVIWSFFSFFFSFFSRIRFQPLRVSPPRPSTRHRPVFS